MAAVPDVDVSVDDEGPEATLGGERYSPPMSELAK
jgi:hypothetical protein